MDITRKLAILVFCGVPAIIGGGIVYGLMGSYPAVVVYELMLAGVASAYLLK